MANGPRMPFTDSGKHDKYGNRLSGAIDSSGRGWMKIGNGNHIVQVSRGPVTGEQLKNIIDFKKK